MPSRVGAVVLRVLLAAMFLLSAVAKLMAIDDFELYVFSYGFLSLNATFLVTRLCIGVELALAALIALGWWRRWVNLAAFALLIAFSLFLGYAALIGRDDSCQCFGRLAEMPPALSLLKNALLIVMVLVYSRWSKPSKETKMVLKLLVPVACMVVPFVVSVPDSWMFGPEEVRFGQEAFDQAIGEEGALAEYRINEGRKVVAFVTPGCPYCRMTRQKLGSIADRHDINLNKILFLEPETIGTSLFLDITHGMRPLVMLVDNGSVVTTYHYRNIDEHQIVNFVK